MMDININVEKMVQLGFRPEEVQMLNTLLMNGYSMTPVALSSYGFSYEDSMRLHYMYDIARGKVVINNVTMEGIAKHFTKLNGNIGRINISNLPLSRIRQIPKIAAITGLPKGSYDIYNSKGKELRIYPVTGANDKKILILTRHKPVLRYGSEKKLYRIKNKRNNRSYYTEDSSKIGRALKVNTNVEISTILEIKRMTQDKKKIEIAIHRDYIRLLNRYIILCSFRKPEFHLGLYEIVLWEGTRIYVYGEYMGKGEAVSYNNNIQRVYAYDYRKEKLPFILKEIAWELYKQLNGVFANELPATMEYSLFETDQKEKNKGTEKGKMEY